MDFGTIIGLIAGIGLVTAAILLGETASAFWSLPSLLIVVGGTLASTLIKFPLSVVVGTVDVVRLAFVRRAERPEELVGVMVRLAQEVRRESLLALERVPVSDPFLKRGVGLAVDGTEPALIESLLRAEAIAEQERHDRGQRIFRTMGQTAPAFGMIGTLIGLVQMLTRMDDPSKIGGAMAVAILTTFYGAALAYLVFIPIAEKLSERSRTDWLHREMAIQGLLSILNGHHPRLVERRLHGILGPGRSTNGRLPRNRLRPAA
ncbi:MAG: MotA/TolQ/ExbB proton channel family protein [Candidatus Eisenbacteria bacterium]|uniref:MotA/TolQ/ExbB proton channel family protein n=1 Tax=Eiseniibacteriota bacterium TaxID=2212470 RepID=A0A956LYQ0_UNCEI|nr:MotA/TolQ/ExbB proton channel family protein [Candidatus Eisenbacteria bacterium]